MSGLHTGWDNRTAEQWLDDAGRFERMAERFNRHPHLNASFSALARDARTRAVKGPASARQSLQDYDWSRIRRLEAKAWTTDDLDYFRMRAASERVAAEHARDMRVRRVHLEMAERYGALIRIGERGPGARPRNVS